MSQMSATGLSPTGATMEHGDLRELAARLGIDLQTLSEEKVRDLLGRVRVADIDGFAEIAATEKKKAYKLIRAYSEKASRIQERKALRTPDSEKACPGHTLALFGAHLIQACQEQILAPYASPRQGDDPEQAQCMRDGNGYPEGAEAARKTR